VGWLAEPYINTVLELSAIFVAALAGGLAGVRRNFDLFGVLVVSWITALAGGVLRDVMIGSIPPVGIANWRFVAVALLGGLVAFFGYPRVRTKRRAIIVLDAFALALFVLIGTSKGMEYDVGKLAAMMVGLATGIAGGIIRDLLVGEIPLVLADRQFYAIPALIGAFLTALAWDLGALNTLTRVGIVVFIIGFRLLALRRHWHVPAPTTAEGNEVDHA